MNLSVWERWSCEAAVLRSDEHVHLVGCKHTLVPFHVLGSVRQVVVQDGETDAQWLVRFGRAAGNKDDVSLDRGCH